MSAFLAGTLLGLTMGACIGIFVLAIIQSGAPRTKHPVDLPSDADLMRARVALNRADARTARVWSNVPKPTVILGDDEDEHVTNLGAV